MKKLVTYLLCIVMLLCLTTPVLANSQELRFSSAMTVEDYVDELIRVFPEANLNKTMLITPQINDSTPTIPTTVRETYQKTIDGNSYTLYIYNDEAIGLLIENKEEYVARSTWNKLFTYVNYYLGYDPNIIYIRVYYDFTGQNTAPDITSINTTGDYVTIVDTGYMSTYAWARGNAYYDGEPFYGYTPKIYFVGMELIVTSDYGHNFIKSTGTDVLY